MQPISGTIKVWVNVITAVWHHYDVVRLHVVYGENDLIVVQHDMLLCNLKICRNSDDATVMFGFCSCIYRILSIDWACSFELKFSAIGIRLTIVRIKVDLVSALQSFKFVEIKVYLFVIPLLKAGICFFSTFSIATEVLLCCCCWLDSLTPKELFFGWIFSVSIWANWHHNTSTLNRIHTCIVSHSALYSCELKRVPCVYASVYRFESGIKLLFVSCIRNKFGFHLWFLRWFGIVSL